MDVLNENYIFEGAVWRQIYSWLLEKNIFVDDVRRKIYLKSEADVLRQNI